MRNNKVPYIKSLYIRGTSKTPHIFFDPKNQIFEISGKSVPENAHEFYIELLEWFDDYLQNPNEETVLNIYLDYFNTSSSRYLLLLLYKLNKMDQEVNSARIKWIYSEGDLDMLEAGEDYAFMVNVPFEFTSSNDNVSQVAS